MPEMKPIRIDNAKTATTSAPTVATDGIAVPSGSTRKYSRFATEIVAIGGTTPTLTTALGFAESDEIHLLVRMAAASGNPQCQVRVHGYLSSLYDTSDTKIASSNGWYEIFDTELVIRSADFNMAFPIKLV
jgi:hypothetical protein